MRKFLFFLALAIFLYSPYGPSWGQFAVNMSLIVAFFSFMSKAIPPRRHYDEEEEYN
ncbi:hypothetical protein GCM10011375_39470 [Hymenobacter qilianensis]|uniref:Uncharacterized protein n=1 Tax=Hymenobacter qilianensis TaxID=1385715 RepID=A0ACB5PX34_9BACT|nr:hypothetical protein [Hymenobacter qilianensis]GGF80472.1 hypothetical protein GCM10011375_39470 [Hymenobacter qilianensis]